jgi:hypothetical protein
MDAKTRYLKRRQLQAALSRVISVLIRNVVADIPPDKTTAGLAALVIQGLTPFVQDARVDLYSLPPVPDLTRHGFIINARKRQTRASYKSRRKKAARQRDPGRTG